MKGLYHENPTFGMLNSSLVERYQIRKVNEKHLEAQVLTFNLFTFRSCFLKRKRSTQNWACEEESRIMELRRPRIG